MSRILWKSFHLCFPTNLTKCSSPPCLPSSSSSAAAAGEESSDPNRSSILHNFNLLYHNLSPTTSSSSSYESDKNNYDIAPDSPPWDFSAVFASRRFFFSSPGTSNAITDSPRDLSDNYDSATTTTTPKKKKKKKNYDTATAVTTKTSVSRLLSGGAAVMEHVHSPDPYNDFRRSMQEMIDAMDVSDADVAPVEQGYEFLHELLLGYLSLNPSDTHEFIIRAFADILVSLFLEGGRSC